MIILTRIPWATMVRATLTAIVTVAEPATDHHQRAMPLHGLYLFNDVQNNIVNLLI